MPPAGPPLLLPPLASSTCQLSSLRRCPPARPALPPPCRRSPAAMAQRPTRLLLTSRSMGPEGNQVHHEEGVSETEIAGGERRGQGLQGVGGTPETGAEAATARNVRRRLRCPPTSRPARTRVPCHSDGGGRVWPLEGLLPRQQGAGCAPGGAVCAGTLAWGGGRCVCPAGNHTSHAAAPHDVQHTPHSDPTAQRDCQDQLLHSPTRCPWWAPRLSGSAKPRARARRPLAPSTQRTWVSAGEHARGGAGRGATQAGAPHCLLLHWPRRLAHLVRRLPWPCPTCPARCPPLPARPRRHGGAGAGGGDRGACSSWTTTWPT